MANQDGDLYAATTAIADADLIFIRKDSDGLWRKMTGADLKSIMRDLDGNELIIDADGDTSVTADTDDRVDFKIGGTDLVRMDSMGLVGSIRSRQNDITIADDGVHSITFGGDTQSIMAISGNLTSSGSALVHIKCDTSLAQSAVISSNIDSGSVVATTGVLTGTDGTDGNLTISAHTDNKVYIENRTGASRGYQVAFLAIRGAGPSSL